MSKLQFTGSPKSMKIHRAGYINLPAPLVETLVSRRIPMDQVGQGIDLFAYYCQIDRYKFAAFLDNQSLEEGVLGDLGGMFIGNMMSARVSCGRLSILPFRETLGLERKVNVVPQGKYFELWEPQAFLGFERLVVDHTLGGGLGITGKSQHNLAVDNSYSRIAKKIYTIRSDANGLLIPIHILLHNPDFWLQSELFLTPNKYSPGSELDQIDCTEIITYKTLEGRAYALRSDSPRVTREIQRDLAGRSASFNPIRFLPLGAYYQTEDFLFRYADWKIGDCVALVVQEKPKWHVGLYNVDKLSTSAGFCLGPNMEYGLSIDREIQYTRRILQ